MARLVWCERESTDDDILIRKPAVACYVIGQLDIRRYPIRLGIHRMNTKKIDEPNVKQAVPLFAVSNMEQSLSFYVNGLGFTMTNKWIADGKLRWCWLKLGGAAIMLQEFKKEGHNSWAQ